MAKKQFLPALAKAVWNDPYDHQEMGEYQRGDDKVLLNEHACDVAAVMKQLLQRSEVRERLVENLSYVNIYRLSFLAGLHDAGKVNTAFQRDIYDVLESEEEGYGPLSPHCSTLWAVLVQPAESWTPACWPETAPKAVDACKTVQALLLNDERSAWFQSPQTELLYWKEILSHHDGRKLKTKDPEKLEPVLCPEEWVHLWHDNGFFSPSASLRSLLVTLGIAFPRLSGGAQLPSTPAFLAQVGHLVTHADRLASKASTPGFAAAGFAAAAGNDRFPSSEKAAESIVDEGSLRKVLAFLPEPHSR